MLRHWKGVLPSNTLACLYGLTEDVRERRVLGKDLKWQIKLIDEAVQKVEIGKILKESKKKDTRVIVCLVGIQSNQFPRASDLAIEFRGGGINVLMGGFHISGSLSMSHDLPPEIKILIDKGATMIAGEVEGRWENILQDALQDKLKPIYNYLLELPNIRFAPMPKVSKEYLRHFISSNFATLDCGRGCPFNCSFCTVINVHGRMMRDRDVNKIMDLLRENYYKHKVSFYFFTDDNFCRNKNWETIFDNLIQMRTKEKIPIEFMIQVDTQVYKIPHFIEKASQAGCTQMFIGMESLNPQNLESAGKKQNHIETFKELISLCRKFGIVTHAAYIIGFPFDTYNLVKEDVDRLKSEVQPEQASFFILTPLPGSRDYVQLKLNNGKADSDLNQYDSFHVTTPHPNMTQDELMQAYKDAWSSFYSLENMVEILRRVSPQNYWDVFMKFLWYKNSIMIENGHPMMEGFIKIKDRLQRRPTYQIDSPLKHIKLRLKDMFQRIKLCVKLLLEMEEVWLRTRTRSALEQRIVEELLHRYAYTKQWRDLKLEELKSIYYSASQYLAKRASRISAWKKIVTPFNLWLRQRNFFSQSLTYSRKSFAEFWQETSKHIAKGHVHCLNISKLASTLVQESLLLTHFIYSFLVWLVPNLFRDIFWSQKKRVLLTPSDS